jgi:hypothetical protein
LFLGVQSARKAHSLSSRAIGRVPHPSCRSCPSLFGHRPLYSRLERVQMGDMVRRCGTNGETIRSGLVCFWECPLVEFLPITRSIPGETSERADNNCWAEMSVLTGSVRDIDRFAHRSGGKNEGNTPWILPKGGGAYTFRKSKCFSPYISRPRRYSTRVETLRI